MPYGMITQYAVATLTLAILRKTTTITLKIPLKSPIFNKP